MTELLLIILVVTLPVTVWLVIRQFRFRRDLRLLKASGNDHILGEEELLHTLINNLPDLIYIKDKDSKFVITNQKHAEHVGMASPVMMIGKTDYDFYPPEIANNFYWSEKELMANKFPVINREEEAINCNGDKIILLTTKIPLINSDGNCYGLAGIGRDITLRKKTEQQLMDYARELEHVNKLLEEKQDEIFQQSEELSTKAEDLRTINLELEKLSLVASKTDDVVLILDAAGNLEWVNESFTRTYGYLLDAFISDRGRNLIQFSYNPQIREIFDKCRETKQTIRYQNSAHDKNGNEMWTQSTLTPILDNQMNISRFIAIDSNITALKKAQELINQHTQEIEQQRDQLQKLVVTKDKLISIIAHDLRNPIHSIMGFSDLLIKNMSSVDDDKRHEYNLLIYESAQQTHDLLENLLHWSRAQTDHIQYKPVMMDLYPVVNDIYYIIKVSLEKKKLTFTSEVTEETRVFADNNMIHTIIRNLLSNAIKFTPENGRITVGLKDQENDLLISISDTGVGIKKEDIGKVLSINDFHSTNGTDGERGTGLGLILCQDFIRQHGKTLEVESEPGKGSTFSFALSKKPAQ